MSEVEMVRRWNLSMSLTTLFRLRVEMVRFLLLPAPLEIDSGSAVSCGVMTVRLFDIYPEELPIRMEVSVSEAIFLFTKRSVISDYHLYSTLMLSLISALYTSFQE